MRNSRFLIGVWPLLIREDRPARGTRKDYRDGFRSPGKPFMAKNMSRSAIF